MMLLDGTPIYRTSYFPSRRQIMVTRTPLVQRKLDSIQRSPSKTFTVDGFCPTSLWWWGHAAHVNTKASLGLPPQSVTLDHTKLPRYICTQCPFVKEHGQKTWQNFPDHWVLISEAATAMQNFIKWMCIFSLLPSFSACYLHFVSVMLARSLVMNEVP